MSDVLRIPPRHAKGALVTWLRRMADAVEAGEVQWVAAVTFYTLEGAKNRDRAFDQMCGFPQCSVDDAPWMMPLGILRSAYLDFEAQLLDVGARSIKEPAAYTT